MKPFNLNTITPSKELEKCIKGENPYSGKLEIGMEVIGVGRGSTIYRGVVKYGGYKIATLLREDGVTGAGRRLPELSTGKGWKVTKESYWGASVNNGKLYLLNIKPNWREILKRRRLK